MTTGWAEWQKFLAAAAAVTQGATTLASNAAASALRSTSHVLFMSPEFLASIGKDSRPIVIFISLPLCKQRGKEGQLACGWCCLNVAIALVCRWPQSSVACDSLCCRGGLKTEDTALNTPFGEQFGFSLTLKF